MLRIIIMVLYHIIRSGIMDRHDNRHGIRPNKVKNMFLVVFFAISSIFPKTVTC